MTDNMEEFMKLDDGGERESYHLKVKIFAQRVELLLEVASARLLLHDDTKME